MAIQLASVEHAPRSVPGWHQLMDDLCNPPAHRVARVLGVSLRSVYRYQSTGNAPKAVCLALYWLTTWGRAAVHAQATADAQLAVACVQSLQREIERLESQITHLRAIGHFGAANDPDHRPTRPALPGANLIEVKP